MIFVLLKKIPLFYWRWQWGEWLRYKPACLLPGVVLALFFRIQATAQTTNLHYQWLKPGQAVLPDTATVFPGSLRVVLPADTALHFFYDPFGNTLRFTGTRLPDSVLVSYRTLGYHLGKKQFHADRLRQQSTQPYAFAAPKSQATVAEKREEWFNTRNLSKSGSLTRGISFGNTQNVFVNAGLNLQLEGKISEDISVVAAISDQNVPYQPEGNTQTLQQFDRVFVQLAGKKTKLTVGDIVLSNPLATPLLPTSYFLRYYKNVQGGLVENAVSRSETRQAMTSAGGAVAKGRFASIFVDALEGIQGPYRLRGPNNERYIIVLANSERIFVDGRQLERGFNADYVIDYNLAEITFNPRIVITKFTRIRVDFEFSERNYSRAIFAISHRQRVGKWAGFVNYYSEKDNPRNPVTVSLSDNDRQILSQAGNDIDKAIAPAVTQLAAFDEKQVLYRQVDSVVNGQLFTLYRYSTNPADARFQLSFTDLGTGNGNYILKTTLANGRVYEWQAAVNGIRQGSYEPVRLLPAPNKRQMLTAGLQYEVSATEKIVAETAYSDRDVNLLSSIGNSQNTAAAFKTGYKNTGKKIAGLPDYVWTGELGYELNQRNFNPIDRFRDIDFDRDWSLRLDTVIAAQEQIITGKFGIMHKPGFTNIPDTSPPPKPGWQLGSLLYEATKRIRSQQVDGWQHRVNLQGSAGRLQVLANAFFLFAEHPKDLTTWQRFRTELRYPMRFVTPGYVLESDKNKINSLVRRDSVLRTVMNFTAHTLFLQNADTLATRFRLDYTWREDNLPVAGRLLRNNLSQTANGSFNARIAQTQELTLTTTYRILSYVLQNLPDEETVMGRIDWNGDFWKQNIRSQLTYNVATGRELKREFIFLPVPAGQGTHTWRDDNKDGIQQLTEFYEAINPDERTYVKFFTPTDQYIRAYTQNFNYRLNLNFPSAWANEEGLRALLARFSSVSSWIIFRKMTDESLWKRFVPFSQVTDSQVLSEQNAFRTTLFFNRTNPAFGSDLALSRNLHKQLLTNGFETGNTSETRLTTRWHFQKAWNAKLSMAKLLWANASDFLSTRNYAIRGWQLAPELNWQPGNDIRLSGSYSLSLKKNGLSHTDTQPPEQAVLRQTALEIRWNKLQKRSLTATLKQIQIDFKNGITDSPVGYEMLEALRPGSNWNWNLTWQQRLGSGLQLNLTYEGRQSENQRVIQIGRVQVAALF